MANQKGFNGATILELEAKGDFFTRRTLVEQKRIEDVDAALRQVRSDINDLRLKTKSGAIDVLNLHMTTPNPAYQRADGVDPTGLADQNQKKLASNLEMRLNKILIRHSEVINNNARLKAQINQLRREHVAASEVHNQFEAGIKQAQRETSAMLARASLINDHREELVRAKEDLLAQNRETKERFAKRMDSLSEIIEMESDRFEATMEREGQRGKDVISALAAVEKAGSLTVEEEHEERSRLTQVEDAEKKERANEKAIEAKIKWYEEAFKELKAASNIDDLDRLIEVFLKQEDEHFSLFNYIQTVNQETDQHLEKTERLEVEIKNFEEEQNVEERQRVAVIRDLHERVEMQRTSDQAWAKKVEEAQAMVDGLVKKAHSICFKTQCDQYLQTAYKDATGERAAELQSMASTLSGQGITVSNVVDYMGLIEQRSIQVIANYAKWLATKDPDSNPIRGPFQPPSWELQEGSAFPDVSEDDESEGDGVKSSDGPLSMSETRKEMQKRMGKKVARMRRKAGLLQRINSRSTGSLPKEL